MSELKNKIQFVKDLLDSLYKNPTNKKNDVFTVLKTDEGTKIVIDVERANNLNPNHSGETDRLYLICANILEICRELERRSHDN